MIAILLLGLLQDDAAASMRFVPEQAVLGQPVELVLEVTHPADVPFAWGAVQPEPDPSWVVLGSRRELSAVDAEGRQVARRVWEIASLEPGPRRAPEAFRLALEEAGVVVLGLEPLLDVTGVLAEGEDEPRPLRDFPDSLAFDGSSTSTFPWPWIAALSTLAFLFAYLLWRKPRSESELMRPLDELARLKGAPEQDGRDMHFALSRLVRNATDTRLGRKLQGLTDEEWLSVASADAGLPTEVQGELIQLFERVAAVKYAGETPSSWAIEETLAGAERVIQLVEKAPNAPVLPATTPAGKGGRS